MLTCTITYESLYKIPRPYCLEDEVIAMTSLSGLFRTSLCDIMVLLFRTSLYDVIVLLVYKPTCFVVEASALT
jgi:hypothetical protein